MDHMCTESERIKNRFYYYLFSTGNGFFSQDWEFDIGCERQLLHRLNRIPYTWSFRFWADSFVGAKIIIFHGISSVSPFIPFARYHIQLECGSISFYYELHALLFFSLWWNLILILLQLNSHATIAHIHPIGNMKCHFLNSTNSLRRRWTNIHHLPPSLAHL